jgi:hypothetical protein
MNSSQHRANHTPCERSLMTGKVELRDLLVSSIQILSIALPIGNIISIIAPLSWQPDCSEQLRCRKVTSPAYAMAMNR